MAVVVILLGAWCALDSWNRSVRDQLFHMRDVPTRLAMNPETGRIDFKSDFQNFTYPMTLALLQFAFMGSVFLCVWLMTSTKPRAELNELRSSSSSMHWPLLGIAHIFSIFFLQALVLPRVPGMAIGAWAAAHAVEVPTAAVLRSRVLGMPNGGHAVQTTGLMCLAALLLFVSYSKIAECLCIFTGAGLTLTGPALYFVYALVLTVPVASVVYQEATVSQHRLPPLLVLAVQNVIAFAVFAPFVFGAALLGIESPSAAIALMSASPEVRMLVLWLCAQAVMLSGVGCLTIQSVGSFWTVALRSLRVVFWWVPALIGIYSKTGMMLSVVRPEASSWSFVMLCGFCLTVAAASTDRPTSMAAMDRKGSVSRAEQKSETLPA